jgi:hypothetical protein
MNLIIKSMNIIYIHLLTDKYTGVRGFVGSPHIFIGLGIDEYNLNYIQQY